MGPRRLVIATAALAWLLATPRAGQAQPVGPSPVADPPAETPTPPPVVSVSVAGSAADAGRIDSALRELLGRLGATLTLERVDPSEQAPARPAVAPAAWVGIDLTSADRAVVTVIDTSAGAPALWRVLEQRGSRQILLEQTVHVVHTAVEGVLTGKPAPEVEEPATPTPTPPAAPPPPSPAPTPAPATPPPPSPPSSAAPPDEALWGLDAGAFIAGHGMADNAGLVFGATGALSAGYRHGPWRVGGWLTAEYRVPFDVDDSEASPRAQAVALRTFPTLGLLQTEAVALDLGLGGGIDIFTVDYRLAAPNGNGMRQTSTKVAPIVTSMLVLQVALVDNVQLSALAGIDVDPSRPQLEVRQGLPDEARPWVVRPTLMIGVSFTLVGTEPFE